MSLIFSALSEIDRQAGDGQSDPALMGAAPPRALFRRGVVVPLVLLILAAGVVAWLLVRPAAPSAEPVDATPRPVADAPAQVAVASAPADEPQEPAASVLPGPASGVAAVREETALPEPPYAPVAEPAVVPTPAAGNRRVRIVSGDTAEPRAVRERPPVADAVPKLVASAAEPKAEPMHVASVSRSDPPDPVTNVSTTPAAAPTAPVRNDAPAQQDAPLIGSNNFIKVGQRPQPASDDGVEQLVSTFRSAMARGDHAAARTALARLDGALPPRSLTLLRMQAWYAVDSGDDATARQRYSRLLQRLPDDINAGVNVALIDWRAGDRHRALRRINQMYTQHPDSDLVKRNWRAMHRQRQ